MGKDNKNNQNNINNPLIIDVIKGMEVKPIPSAIKNPVVNTTQTNNSNNSESK